MSNGFDRKTYIFTENHSLLVIGNNTRSDLSAFTTGVSEIVKADSEYTIYELVVKHASAIFDVQLVGMWVYDADAEELQLTTQTQKADDLFGTDVVYQPGNSMSWQAFEQNEVFHFSDQSAVGEYDEDSVVQSEIIIPVGEYGVINIASQQTSAFTEDDVELAKTFGTVVNDAIKQINEKHTLRVQNERLEEVISLVSHDLRNPLNVADGRVELALQQSNSESVTEQLETAAASLNRMETLIEDLLLLADKGYVVEDRTSLSLAEVTREAWNNVASKDAELEVQDSVTVFGEKKRLLQVFENLFRNAIEHGGTDITVTVRPIESFFTTTRGGGQEASDGFIVEDTGKGLPEDLDIFDSGTSTSGSGLGLTIVQRIIEAHRWNIEATDGPSGGAQFKITAGEKSVTPFR
jgi:signal transduction histidine kinase